MKECIICITETNFKSKCGCIICLDCIISWFEEKNRTFRVNEIKCQCNETYTRNEILQYCQEQPYQDRIQSVLVKEYLKNNDIRSCPSGKCNNYGFVIEKDLCDDELECNNCHIKWRDYSIATYESRMLYSLQNITSSIKEFLYYFIRTNECPGCGIQIERSGGCKHMTCKACPQQFCWHCKQNWFGHKEGRCFSSLISFISLLCAQPLNLLYQLGAFSYIFGIIFYPIKVLGLFLATHFIVIVSISAVCFTIMTFKEISRFRYMLLNVFKLIGISIEVFLVYVVFGLAETYLDLQFYDFVYSFLFDLVIAILVFFYVFRFQVYLGIYPILAFAFMFYLGFDGFGILIWLMPIMPNLKRRVNPIICKFICYILLTCLNIFNLWEHFCKPYIIIMIVIDLIIYREDLYHYLIY